MPERQMPNKLLSLAVLAILLVPGCVSVGDPAQRSCFHRNAPAEVDIGYCQAVRIGNTLHISGVAGQGEMAAAVRSVYSRLKLTLDANGLSFADVVKENVYATDLDSFIRSKEVRKEFYGQSFPAATWVQVQRLYVPSLVVEVELTAVYPK
jgi:2-iminobutanoate/2-iminopropanoate deaminase